MKSGLVLGAAMLLVSATVVAAGHRKARPSDLGDLPLVVVPAQGPQKPWMAIVVSGDGGWAPLVRTISKTLARNGVPVIGLNSRRYFWRARTPEESAKDLERILDQSLARYGKEKIVLIGYSRGACVLPFMVNPLPRPLQDKIAMICLLGPESDIEFEIHVSALWNGREQGPTHRVRPEVEKLRGHKVLCFQGTEEKDSLCPELQPVAQTILFPGGHHFDGKYGEIATAIIDEAGHIRAGP